MHTSLSCMHELLHSLSALARWNNCEIVIIIWYCWLPLICYIANVRVKSLVRQYLGLLLPLLTAVSLFENSIRGFNNVPCCRSNRCLIAILEVKSCLIHNCWRWVVAAPVLVNGLWLSRCLYKIEVCPLVLGARWSNRKALFLRVTRINLYAVPGLSQTLPDILSVPLILHHYQTLVQLRVYTCVLVSNLAPILIHLNLRLVKGRHNIRWLLLTAVSSCVWSLHGDGRSVHELSFENCLVGIVSGLAMHDVKELLV